MILFHNQGEISIVNQREINFKIYKTVKKSKGSFKMNPFNQSCKETMVRNKININMGSKANDLFVLAMTANLFFTLCVRYW